MVQVVSPTGTALHSSVGGRRMETTRAPEIICRRTCQPVRWASRGNRMQINLTPEPGAIQGPPYHAAAPPPRITFGRRKIRDGAPFWQGLDRARRRCSFFACRWLVLYFASQPCHLLYGLAGSQGGGSASDSSCATVLLLPRWSPMRLLLYPGFLC